MDQHPETRYGDYPYSHSATSSWSNPNPNTNPNPNHVPPLPYHNGGNFDHGGGFSNSGHYNQHRRYHQPNGHANETTFAGRKRHISHSAHGTPPEYTDGGSYAKLYVQGVPREVTEQDIRFLFGKHGHIIEVVLFREKRNLQQQECCFVKYAKIEDAVQAIRALHDQHTFPGGMYPIQVKYAHGEQGRLGILRTHQFKVFVDGLNKQASKAEIAEIFSPYGFVKEVFLLRDEQKRNIGKGFISFSHRDMAAAAINALNGKFVMRTQRSQKPGNPGLHQISVIQWVQPHYLMLHIRLLKLEASLHQFLAVVLCLLVLEWQIHLIANGVSIYVLMDMHTTITVQLVKAGGRNRRNTAFMSNNQKNALSGLILFGSILTDRFFPFKMFLKFNRCNLP